MKPTHWPCLTPGLLFFFALVCSLGLVAVAQGHQSQQLHVIKQPTNELSLRRSGWFLDRKRVSSDKPITFFIELRTGKEGEVERMALEVSDPDSPSYGKFLSADQLRELVAAPPEVESKVLSWLCESKLPADEFSVVSHGDVLEVKTTVKNTEHLLSTQMGQFTHGRSGRSVFLIKQAAMIPNDVAQHVRNVVGINYPTIPHRITSNRISKEKQQKRQSSAILPKDLRSHYNVSAELTGSTAVSQGIFGLEGYFSEFALKAFIIYNDQTYPPINTLNIGGDQGFSQSIESDLDMQYITGIGTKTPTTFVTITTSESLYTWALLLSSSSNPAMVYSISYGFSEQDFTGYSSGVVSDTEGQMSKLVLRGVSVLAASGDEGAAGFSVACPMDTEKYCFSGNCTLKAPRCAQILVQSWLGTFSFPPTDLSSDLEGMENDVEIFISHQNQSCQVSIETDEKERVWFYSSCECEQLNYTISENLSFYPFNLTQTLNWPIFIASYPATSQWVTAVGATEWNSATVETTASIEGISGITSGGGFSQFVSQPPWQNSSIPSYLENAGNLPPVGSYNVEGRGYPDISLLGHNYEVFGSILENEKIEIVEITVDGTSASTPSLAGMITLINEMRSQVGKNQLGFLNPILYKMAQERPDALTDITTGNNMGNEDYICQYGWSAAPGWDPATGLGVPNFGVMADYMVNQVAGGGASTLNSWLDLFF